MEAQAPAGPAAARRERRTRRALAAAVFLVAAGISIPALVALPEHFDADAYFHLAVARAYAQEGLFEDLAWARFSVMAEGYGDKELLFHLLLAPFASLPDASAGGQAALGLLLAALAAVLAHLGVRAVGAWGCLLPALLVLTAADLDWRLARLRPEVLSLLLLLLAMAAAGAGRHRLTAPLAAVYALSYTAFHALLGLCGLLFLFRGWVRRRWEAPLLLYPVLGVGVGLVAHPHFPDNLEVWVLQNLDFFRFRKVLDVGSEILADTTEELLRHNLGFWLAAAVLLRSTLPKGAERPAERDLADAFAVAAVAMGVLYALMHRFGVYFFPFAALALLFRIAGAGRSLGGWTRLPGRGRLPAAAALGLCVAASAPELGRVGQTLTDPRRAGSEEALAQLGRALPEGAKVAARWSDAHAYVFFAPQGRYLNVLDPVFMASPHPRAYQLQRRIFDGLEPDVPLSSVAGLDSDFLAVGEATAASALLERLAADPRVVHLRTGRERLVRFIEGANGSFLLDWLVEPAAGEAGPWRPYPRLDDPRHRRLEGFVDLRRLGDAARCRRFRHPWEEGAGQSVDVELAPEGIASLSVDGRVRAVIDGEPGAILGRGVRLRLDLPRGEHELTVATCAPRSRPGAGGFYLRRLAAEAVGDGGER